VKIQADVSLYPLRHKDLAEPIRQFVASIKTNNLDVISGSMSSIVSGDSQAVFQALQKAFELSAQTYEIVLTAKISNACPGIE